MQSQYRQKSCSNCSINSSWRLFCLFTYCLWINILSYINTVLPTLPRVWVLIFRLFPAHMRNIFTTLILFLNDVICESDDVTMLSGTPDGCQWDVNEPTCGVGSSEINLKIINGWQARTNDWPWIAYLRIHKRIGWNNSKNTSWTRWE